MAFFTSGVSFRKVETTLSCPDFFLSQINRKKAFKKIFLIVSYLLQSI